MVKQVLLISSLFLSHSAISAQEMPVESMQPEPIKRCAPHYPRKAAKLGLEGGVEMSFRVTKSGVPKEIQIQESWPGKAFDRAAIQALRCWRYETSDAGYESLTQIIEFRLN